VWWLSLCRDDLPRSLNLEKVLRYTLGVLLLVLLVVQALSLYVFPVHDSIRWFGDESWLMTESIAMVETGELHHPHALSSTLSEPKGILFISVPWLRMLLYGVPASLMYPDANPIDVGRTVSWLFSLGLLAIVYWLVKTRTHDALLALTGVLLLAATDAFLFSAHSARYDVLVGLFLLFACAWLSSDRFAELQPAWGAALASFTLLTLAIALPVSLYFYLAVVGMIAFLMLGAHRRLKGWGGAFAGIAGAVGIAALLSLAINGGVAPWSSSQHQGEIGDVTRDIPILHILSLHAQLATLYRNAEIVAAGAPWSFLAVPLLLWTVIRWRCERLALFGVASIIVWYLLQRPHPAYLVHVVPLVLCASFITLHRSGWNRKALRYALAGLAICYALMNTARFSIASSNAENWSVQRSEAMKRISASIDRTSRKPLVMVEATANGALLADTSIQLMTTHFQFFPKQKQTVSEVIDREGVDYVVIFNAANYGYDRSARDPLVRTVRERSELVRVETGEFFDIDRSYFEIHTAQPALDTLFLYKITK
jgi:hypothetical protein